MVIVCDVDGVLNNLMDVVLEIYNKQHNTLYTTSGITTYNLENCFALEVAKEMKEIFNDAEIWYKTKPLKWAQDGLRKLINDGHRVYLATDNNPHTYGEKVAWIRHYFPFIEESKIICIKDKWLLTCDVMIEDCIENLLVKPYYHRILMDHPWNRSSQDKDWAYDIYRCSNWNQIVDAVNQIQLNEKE